jgi:hypothetical protein
MLHRLMIGTWTPPGAIFTVVFDDENRTLELVKKTDIPHDEPISWMTFDVSLELSLYNCLGLTRPSTCVAHKEEYLWSRHEKVV